MSIHDFMRCLLTNVTDNVIEILKEIKCKNVLTPVFENLCSLYRVLHNIVYINVPQHLEDIILHKTRRDFQYSGDTKLSHYIS